MGKQISIFSRVRFMVLIAVCTTLFVVAGCAKKPNRTTKVTVAGEAVTKVEPDVAVLVIAVVTQSAQAIEAQQQNARKSEAVGSAVKALAGADAEIKTSDYTLQPQYDYRDSRLPKIIGYDARNTVTVTTSDLKNVGAVIDAASQAGANSIQSVSFVLRQTSPARGVALRDATRQAMNKAQSIAEALGGRVLRVVEENEGTTVNGSPAVYEATDRIQLSGTSQTTTPIVSGNLSIRSNVQLIVEIES
jgi:uncharacterized protein YggE